MLSQKEEETSFTLSFGGVDFCLAPGAAHETASTDVVSISKLCPGEVLITLKNFVGTLRVTNPKTIAAPSSSAVPVTDSLVGKETIEDGMSIDIADGEETSDVAAAAAVVTEAPNPVEDTPSPLAKVCEEVELAETEKPKQRKGQQKLDFFGKKGKKQNKSETKNTRVASASKRSPRRQALEPANRKKLRKSPRKSKEEQAPNAEDCPMKQTLEPANRNKSRKSKLRKSNRKTEAEEEEAFNAADFSPIDMEELKSETIHHENSFTFAQSMPSQDNESIGDGHCDLALDSQRENTLTMEDEKTKSNLKEDSKMPVQVTPAPCSRWGHTMNMIDHKRFIVYGGQMMEKDVAQPLADLFVYDIMEHTWTRPINCDGIARTWHTANFLPERQLLLCFGGEVLSETTGKLTTTDQVMVLDCEIMLWYPPTVSGQVPSGRSGHASCVLPGTNSLVVFGGVKHGKWLNSASILDTNRWKWTTLKAVGDAPPPRSYHSATAISSDGSSEVGNQVVIFGGNDGDKCFNGVHVLESTGAGKKWVWSHPKCTGHPPTPRTGHNAMLMSDGVTILVYGGWDPNDDNDLIFGDSFLLDTKTWVWRKGPKPKYTKSMNKMANGGAARVGHSAVLAPGAKGVQVLAFGGRVPENTFVGDFQSLVVP